MELKKLDFQLLNQKWGTDQAAPSSGGIVDFSFANQNFSNQSDRFDSFLEEKFFTDVVLQAFKSWEMLSNIRFQNVPDNPNVDIRLGWASIDGEGGSLGEAILPFSGPLENIIIRFDQDENWAGSTELVGNELNFRSLAAHEIGHSLGIGHSADNTALMFDFYNAGIFTPQVDDALAIQAIYGSANKNPIEVLRVFNRETGSHLYTPSSKERDAVLGTGSFAAEGVGFTALSTHDDHIEGSVPIHRFFNKVTGGHFFTAFETEKDVVSMDSNFRYEGQSFRAFDTLSSSLEPVYRFFNLETGGHFYTTSSEEKDVIASLSSFRNEGIGFYAFSEILF